MRCFGWPYWSLSQISSSYILVPAHAHRWPLSCSQQIESGIELDWIFLQHCKSAESLCVVACSPCQVWKLISEDPELVKASQLWVCPSFACIQFSLENSHLVGAYKIETHLLGSHSRKSYHSMLFWLLEQYKKWVKITPTFFLYKTNITW